MKNTMNAPHASVGICSAAILLLAGTAAAQGVRPYQRPGAAPALQQSHSSQDAPVSKTNAAPASPYSRAPWEDVEDRWLAVDKSLPAQLYSIPDWDLERALETIQRAASLADEAFSSKHGYWNREVLKLEGTEQTYATYLKDIPARQREIESLHNLATEEVRDLDQREARLKTMLTAMGLPTNTAEPRLSEIRSLSQQQVAATEVYRQKLNERLANLTQALEYLRQLKSVFVQYRLSAQIERALWREHYNAVGDLRRNLHAKYLFMHPPRGSQGGTIRMPGSQTIH